MANEGSNTETLAPVESLSLENRHFDPSQQQSSSYAPSTTGSAAGSWTVHSSTENGIYSNPLYQYDQHTQPPARSIQDGQNASSVAGNSSNLGTASVPQDYNAYTSYPSSSNQYGYGSMGYMGYYNSYQPQPSHTYSQPVGAYQNTGAPYQPPSSFPNTGSYAGSASYSSTYYNPGDYQTPGGYQNSSYGNQTALWNNGNYSSYSSQQYTSYTPDPNGAYSSSTPATTLQYQQHYKQWADYYNQTEVSCAPGTENSSVTSSSTLSCPIPAVTSSYATPNSQPPPSYAPYWRPESSLSAMPPLQPGAVSSGAHDGYWKHGAQNSQIHQTNPLQPNYQTPFDLKSSYDKFQDQQKTASSQGSNLQYPPPPSPPPQQVTPTPVQTAPSLDIRRVSKLQIPTNPRIASNLTMGLPKTDKDSSTICEAKKPAYISVSLPKPSEKVSSSDAATSILKPGMFPKSLRGYVERALARCQDDKQMEACQAVMKEMITKATADGTLYTQNWDMEPLFSMPDADVVGKNGSQSTIHDSLLPKYKRSPSRRSKSRWEPLPEEKPVDNPVLISNDTVKYSAWIHNEDRKVGVENKESMENGFRNTKFSPFLQKTSSKTPQRAFKKQRLADTSVSSENGDASSDSDKEQSLTAYYSSAMPFADSPEERKRRENRSKRFDLAQGHRLENSHFRQKNAGAGNLYNRRASALVLSKTFEDSNNRAVEDIDWDALTVKGTCQEIEKRYLRLTSAPDPATVRPEDILEKALSMVQNSPKNYLYKCDQLKSIRQDLTVQRIRNQLTVKVYETHGRLTLEVGDLPEYNQCQSQLKTLYAEGIEGSHLEFAAYNLLCVILHSNNYRELLSSMSRLSAEAKKDEAVKHALAVRASVTSGNYVTFFRLYKAAPNLNTCLMDLYVEKMRYKAVNCMCRSYRPTVPVSYVSQVLGFPPVMASNGVSDEKDTDSFEECVEWLKAHGASIISDNNGDMLLDTKGSSSNLFVPEPEDAVSHGDANLAVNDFLARAPL